MKKIALAILLVICFVLPTLTACDIVRETETSTSADRQTEVLTQSETEVSTQSETETPTQSDTETPTQSETEESTQNETEFINDTETPTEQETESDAIFSDGLRFSSNGDGTCYVSGIGTCTDTNIVIPSISPYGDIVTGIGSDYYVCGFANCYDIASIVIPNSVTSIGKGAFSNCSNLTGIIIPNSIVSIDEEAFYDCYNLAYNEYDNAYYLGNDTNPYVVLVKAKDTSITSCEISGETNVIYYEAFRGCSSLASITVPDGVKSIGSSVFLDCSNLTSITLPFIGASANDKTGGGIGYKSHFGYIFGYNSWQNTYHDTRTCQYNEGSRFYNYNIPYSLQTVVISGKDTIDPMVFRNCNYLENITLSGGTTDIGYDAFYGCLSLENITIPDSVTCINGSAFENCSSLKSITIPDSVTYIGANVFMGCSSLESISLPFVGKSINATDRDADFGSIFGASTTTTYSPSLHYHYRTYVSNGGYYVYWTYQIPYSLKHVVITGGGSIGELAFYNCDSLESVTITQGVTSIGSFAFDNCKSLTNIVVPNSVTSIGLSAFSGCTSLTSVTVPFVGATKESTENTHFGYIFGGSNVYVPESIKTVVITGGEFISDSAFSDCSSLTSVVIPDSVTSIGASAFYNCSGLTSAVIPDSVTYIGVSAFEKCTNLTSITLPFIGDTKDGTIYTHLGYIFGALSYTEHPSNVPKSLQTVVVTGGASVKSNAFRNCATIKDVSIPMSVDRIYTSAFEGCVGLVSVTFEENSTLKYIESRAFYNCARLNSIVLPNSVTSIGISAFEQCTSLQAITLPFIGNTINNTYNSHFGYIFGASSYSENWYVPPILRTVVITNEVKIDDYAFCGCGSLESVTIPEGVISIGDYAFEYCTRLASVTIPDSITSIGEAAFMGCTSLTSIVIPTSVTSIGNYVFSGCSSLTYNEYDNAFYLGNESNPCAVLVKASDTLITSCEINAETKFIHSNAFSGCTSLASVTIPDGVAEIGHSAFRYCSSLTSVVIPHSVESIGSYAFDSCTNLTSVVISDSVMSIGDMAFNFCSGLASIEVDESNANYKSVEGNLYSKDGKILIQYAVGKTEADFTIPEDVTCVGDFAFYDSSSLTSIVIPDSVESIGSYAFENCYALTTVNYTGNQDDWDMISIDYWYNSCLANVTINYNYVPN